MTTCVSCGATLPVAARDCSACGAAVAFDALAPTLQPAEASAVSSPSSRPPARGGPGAGFAPGEVIARRYRIVGLVGRGGMGEVYRADDLKLGQAVALKFLSPSLEGDAAALERLHAEVRTARQVSHPHVCRVHDIDEVGGRHFLTMEYVDGEDLATLLHRIGRLPEDKALEVARQIAAGLQAAHDRGVVHRDLKPANVMIDGHGRARLTDFGLAVDGAIAGCEIAGTPAYMAPEQFRGAAATVRSDLYALGLLLYELFTGRRPFESATFADWKRAHESSTPIVPSQRVRDLDPAIEKLILRCLEKDPARRPRSAAQAALLLPGGDPFAAALAGGETPSPAMVAAADAGGALRRGQAVTGLVAALLLAAAVASTSGGNLYRWTPLERSPEVLADRAATLAAELGYGDRAPGRDWGFEYDDSFLAWDDDSLPPARHWRRVESGEPHAYAFWYRQDPLPLVPHSFGGGGLRAIRRGDPPLIHAGALEMLLDPRGRLLRFEGIPRRPGPAAAGEGVAAGSDPWPRLFSAAGLDPARFIPVSPQWSPSRFADRVLAWQGTFADHADLPLRVEAAALGGTVVWFELVTPWSRPANELPAGLETPRLAAALLAVLTFLVVLGAGAAAVARNLRSGRADRVGAWRLALAGSAVAVLTAAFGTRIPTNLAALGERLLATSELALMVAAFLAFAYLAVEPYVRRRWPEGLISWSRLLAGRWRDATVGRDLLVGVLVGLASTLVWQLSGWLKVWSGSPFPPNFFLIPLALDSLGIAFSVIVSQSIVALVEVFVVLILLSAARRVLRRDLLAAALVWAIWSLIPVLVSVRSGPAVAALLVSNALLIWSVTRLGLLAGVAAAFVARASNAVPITADLAAPYAGTSGMALALVVTIAIVGFRVSKGTTSNERDALRTDD